MSEHPATKEDLRLHAEDNREEFKQVRKEFHNATALLASKEDVAEILKVFKAFRIGFSVLEISGNTAIRIGTYLILIVGIITAIKTLAMWVIVAFFNSK